MKKITASLAKITLVFIFMCFTFIAWADGLQKLTGHHTAFMAQSTDMGEVDNSRTFHIAVSLPLRSPAELDALLKDLYNPKSGSYRRFLTPAEFTSRFGPAEEDTQAVAGYFSARGFTVTKIHSNHVIVDIEGNNDAIQKAFHVRLHNYQRPNGTSFYAPNDDPSVDLNTTLAGISGIDNFVIPRRSASFKAATKPTNLATGGFIAPIDLRNSYAGNVTLKGNGQAIALVEFSNYSSSDIGPFQTAAVTYNSQAASIYSSFGAINNIYLDGLSSSSAYTTDDQEAIVQDLENIESVAPNATLNVYMGGNVDDDLNQIATDNTSKQITTSAEFSTTGSAFSQFAAQGQSYFNSSGDWFSYGSANNTTANPNTDSTYSLNYNYVTIVGGTQLTTTGNPSVWSSEVAWNQGNAASGGGILTLVTIPSYQEGVNMSANGGSTTNRNAPDVSACAYGIWIYENGSWSAWGGTSSSTPIWAAFMSLVNQQAALDGAPSIGWANPSIYAIGENTTKYAADFHDITSGNNGGYNAVAGYDLVTGWGSPNGQSLINDLVGLAQTPSATPTKTPTVNSTHTLTPTVTATATLTATAGSGNFNIVSVSPACGAIGSPVTIVWNWNNNSANGNVDYVIGFGSANTPNCSGDVWVSPYTCSSSGVASPSNAGSSPSGTITSIVTVPTGAPSGFVLLGATYNCGSVQFAATNGNCGGTDYWVSSAFSLCSGVTNTPTFSSTATASFTATPSNTNTAVFTTSTNTLTASPTSTATATYTNTALVFTATSTSTPVPPTATNTSVPFTATATATVTYTATSTFTSAPPTATFTSAPPTASPTGTVTPTKTNTPLPPTATFTPVPPTATFTPVPPTATPTTGGNCSGVAAWSGSSVHYTVGQEVTYNSTLYSCLQAHTSQAGWTPPAVPALWKNLGACH